MKIARSTCSRGVVIAQLKGRVSWCQLVTAWLQDIRNTGTCDRPNQWQHPVADQSLEPDTAPDHIAGTVANNDKYIYIDIDKIPEPTAVAIAHAESDTSNPDILYVDAEAKLDTETADSGVPSNHEQCIPPATQVVYSEASGDIDIVGNDSAEIQSSKAAAATADEYLAAHARVAGWSSCMSVSLAYHGSALTTPPSQPSTRPNCVLLKMLPTRYQYSVLVQGHQAGLVPLTTLQHASSQPPTIVHPLTGMEGLHLLNKIKRQVAFRFHSDKSAGVECDMYKEFNSRVDELTKARSGSEGWTRYNHALSEEIDAAQQYLGCVVDCAGRR